MNISHKKNTDIEILRAISFIFVFITHIRLFPYYSSTPFLKIHDYFEFSTGVDIFLVISGFVILRSLWSIESKHTDVSRRRLVMSFWIKRAFRLLPSAWFWLILSTLVFITIYVLDNGVNGLSNQLWSALAAIFNVMNVYGAHCLMNMDSSICEKNFLLSSIPHYWSLSLEEQFYFLFPLLFLGFSRRLLVVLLCVAIGLLFFYPRPLFSYGYYFRIDGLCWGILLGIFSYHPLYSRLKEYFVNKIAFLRLLAILLVVFIPVVAAQTITFGENFNRF